MERRTFLKLAGVTALAAASSGALTGCSLTTMPNATVDGVWFGCETALWLTDTIYLPSLCIRNTTRETVVIPGQDIYGSYTDKEGNTYPMRNRHSEDIEVAPGEEVDLYKKISLYPENGRSAPLSRLKEDAVSVEYNGWVVSFITEYLPNEKASGRVTKEKVKTEE